MKPNPMPRNAAPRTPARRRLRPQEERDAELALVARIRGGDERAFTELYEATFPRVYGFCRKRVGGQAEAEDLAQETFVQLFRSLHAFEGRSSLMTWTFGIAHNVCARYFRHCSRWMVGPRDARELDERPVDAGTEARVEAQRVLDRCDKVLKKSRRPAHREIFHKRYSEQKSIRKIADEVGKSTEAVKVSLRRSRNALSQGVPEIEAILG